MIEEWKFSMIGIRIHLLTILSAMIELQRQRKIKMFRV